MKKVLFFCVSLVVFVGVVASSVFIGDKTAPTIEIIRNPKLSKDCPYEDILNCVNVYDENLKTFFIENDDVSNVINTKCVTYVAIDESNNVTKVKVPVDIDDDYNTFHIVTKKDLIVQLGERFNLDDYFELRNECDVVVEDRLKMSKFNTNNLGTFDVKIESTQFESEPINVTVTVVDENAPKISLDVEEIYLNNNTYLSDSDFLNHISILEDDKDSKEDLLENIEINWKDVLSADEDGYVYEAGSFEVTYDVVDSDNNKSNAKITVHLEELVREVVEVQEGEGV